MSGAWASRCSALLPTPLPTGLVDRNGQSMAEFNANSTWGIDWEACNTYCGGLNTPLHFDFQNFAGAFTNFFLPWLALIAQLPYQADHPMSDFMSAALALGSPVLITYSLAITIFNRLWAHQEFKKLHARAKAPSVVARDPSLADRIECIKYFIQECQQAPIRVSGQPEALASLLIHPENQEWWNELVKNLKTTRRSTTPPLVAQISVAVIAWLFTVGAAFAGNLGSVSVSLQVSGGSLWLWMIPIIIGWIIVGTQSSYNSIDKALKAKTAMFHTDSGELEPREQLVFVNSSANESGSESSNVAFYLSSTCMLTDLRGDERRNGPAFNYARALTWSRFATTMQIALDNLITNLEKDRPCDEPRQGSHLSTTSTIIPPTNQCTVSGDTSNEASLICHPREIQMNHYPTLKEVPAKIKKNMIVASLIGLFTQWGTTGASIMMAYMTPTVGLSCRSGAYLIYGCIATFVWMLLVTSMGLSHMAMLDSHPSNQQDVSVGIFPDVEKNSAGPRGSAIKDRKSNSRTRWWCRPVRFLAVITLWFGKILAVANAVWLILSSLLEMIGFYENCFCKTNYLMLRERGHALIFRTASDLSVVTQDPSRSGVAFSILVCAIVGITFFCCGRK